MNAKLLDNGQAAFLSAYQGAVKGTLESIGPFANGGTTEGYKSVFLTLVALISGCSGSCGGGGSKEGDDGEDTGKHEGPYNPDPGYTGGDGECPPGTDC